MNYWRARDVARATRSVPDHTLFALLTLVHALGGSLSSAANAGLISSRMSWIAAGTRLLYTSSSTIAFTIASWRARGAQALRHAAIHGVHAAIDAARDRPARRSGLPPSRAMKCCATRYIAATRYAVSDSLENGRWKRAIGRNTAVRGQPLDAMINPISDASACCADNVATTERSSVSTVDAHLVVRDQIGEAVDDASRDAPPPDSATPCCFSSGQPLH